MAYDSDCSAPAEFNLTRHAQEGRNTLEIVVSAPSQVARLESWKSDPAPAIGPAWVMSQPTLRVRDVLTKSWRSSEENDKVMAEIALVVKTESLNPRTSRIHYELLTPAGSNAAIGYKDVTLDMRREDTVRFLARIPDSMLWNPGRPTQYTLRVKTQHEGRYMEYIELPLGFRTVELHNGLLAVNGNPVALRTREVPPQFPAEEIAKLREQGFNTLRLLPGPVSPTLYAVCDTMGMYVIPQAPIDTRSSGESRRIGGNPSNDPAWQGAYVERAERQLPHLEAPSVGSRLLAGDEIGQRHQSLRKLSEYEEVRRHPPFHLSRRRRRMEQRRFETGIIETTRKRICIRSVCGYAKKNPENFSGFFCNNKIITNFALAIG